MTLRILPTLKRKASFRKRTKRGLVTLRECTKAAGVSRFCWQCSGGYRKRPRSKKCLNMHVGTHHKPVCLTGAQAYSVAIPAKEAGAFCCCGKQFNQTVCRICTRSCYLPQVFCDRNVHAKLLLRKHCAKLGVFCGNKAVFRLIAYFVSCCIGPVFKHISSERLSSKGCVEPRINVAGSFHETGAWADNHRAS